MLKRCSDNRDMTEWNEWRKNRPDDDILLEGVDLRGCYLKGAYLNTGGFREDITHEFMKFRGQVYLMGANLRHAYLQGAKLYGAHLERVNLVDARLQRASLSRACLGGAQLETAVVDGETAVWKLTIDRETDFIGVGLGNVRIDPQTKQLLEFNIRRMNWEEWYSKHPLLSWPVRWFWCLSDYGLSTWRVIIWFFGLALGFAAIYANCACWWPPGIVSNLVVEPHLPLWHYFLLVLLRPLYFSVVTMTTLGFGDMHANATSIWGHILLTFQVILGYVLLGALVTRFAVLFTAGGPAGKFADEKTEG